MEYKLPESELEQAEFFGKEIAILYNKLAKTDYSHLYDICDKFGLGVCRSIKFYCEKFNGFTADETKYYRKLLMDLLQLNVAGQWQRLNKNPDIQEKIKAFEKGFKSVEKTKHRYNNGDVGIVNMVVWRIRSDIINLRFYHRYDDAPPTC